MCPHDRESVEKGAWSLSCLAAPSGVGGESFRAPFFVFCGVGCHAHETALGRRAQNSTAEVFFFVDQVVS